MWVASLLRALTLRCGRGLWQTNRGVEIRKDTRTSDRHRANRQFELSLKKWASRWVLPFFPVGWVLYHVLCYHEDEKGLRCTCESRVFGLSFGGFTLLPCNGWKTCIVPQMVGVSMSCQSKLFGWCDCVNCREISAVDDECCGMWRMFTRSK